MPKKTPEKDIKIAQLLSEAGIPSRLIADMLDISTRTVIRHVETRKAKPYRRNKLTSLMKNKILYLHKKGYSFLLISSLLDITPKRVLEFLSTVEHPVAVRCRKCNRTFYCPSNGNLWQPCPFCKKKQTIKTLKTKGGERMNEYEILHEKMVDRAAEELIEFLLSDRELAEAFWVNLFLGIIEGMTKKPEAELEEMASMKGFMEKAEKRPKELESPAGFAKAVFFAMLTNPERAITFWNTLLDMRKALGPQPRTKPQTSCLKQKLN